MTPRQEECLRALAEHGSYKVAAKAIGIPTNTFKAHIRDAYGALGVTTSIEAFRAMGWLRTVEAFPGTGLTLDADIWSRR